MPLSRVPLSPVPHSRAPLSSRSLVLGAAAGVVCVALLTACGEPGSAGNESASGDLSGTAATCEPIADDAIVVLDDDKALQTVDNIIPAVNAEAAEQYPDLVGLLDEVSAALDTETLIELNHAVDVERQASEDVAADFVESTGIDVAKVDDAGSVTIGAANFAESSTLGHIYADVLASSGFDVEVTTIGNREAYLPALEKGKQIQVVPEYTGTLTEFINRDVNGSDATALASSDLDATVGELRDLGAEVGLVFGEPSAAQDQNAYAVTQAFADEHGLETLSDLAEACSGLVLGAGAECTERPFCQPGLEDTYGLTFSEFRSLDAGGPLTKEALKQGKITLGLVFSSDGSLAPSAG